MKKILALVMCCVILLSSSTPFLAKENSDSNISEYQGFTYEYYQKLSEIAEARGITLMPYDEMVENSDSGFEKESNGNSASNMVRGGATADAAVSIYLSSSKYDSIDVAGEADWFKFEVNGNGAHNIYTTGNTDTKVELYKKTWYGEYLLIDSNDDISIADWNCRLEVGLETNIDYYIKITAYGKDTGAYVLRLEENRDQMSSPEGGSWTWDVATPDPDGLFFNVDKITYLDANAAKGYYIMVSDDDFREVRDIIIGLTFDAAVTYVMGYYKIKEAIASYIVSKAVGFGTPNLTKTELNSISEAGGKDSSGNFKYGIKIVSVTTYSAIGAPVMLNTYERWNGSYIYGAERYRGTFDTTDKTPLWR